MRFGEPPFRAGSSPGEGLSRGTHEVRASIKMNDSFRQYSFCSYCNPDRWRCQCLRRLFNAKYCRGNDGNEGAASRGHGSIGRISSLFHGFMHRACKNDNPTTPMPRTSRPPDAFPDSPCLCYQRDKFPALLMPRFASASKYAIILDTIFEPGVFQCRNRIRSGRVKVLYWHPVRRGVGSF